MPMHPYMHGMALAQQPPMAQLAEMVPRYMPLSDGDHPERMYPHMMMPGSPYNEQYAMYSPYGMPPRNGPKGVETGHELSHSSESEEQSSSNNNVKKENGKKVVGNSRKDSMKVARDSPLTNPN